MADINAFNFIKMTIDNISHKHFMCFLVLQRQDMGGGAHGMYTFLFASRQITKHTEQTQEEG